MGFGSTATNWGSPCSDSLSLRLPFRLASPATVTRGLIMQKANGRVPKDSSIACGRTISGLFHSASSGSFRLSLAVLVRYRSSASIQPWRVVPPDSGGVSRAPPYLGYPWVRSGFRLRGFHPLWPGLPAKFAYPLRYRVRVPQPREASFPVWAPALSLATTHAMSVDLFSCGY